MTRRLGGDAAWDPRSATACRKPEGVGLAPSAKVSGPHFPEPRRRGRTTTGREQNQARPGRGNMREDFDD